MCNFDLGVNWIDTISLVKHCDQSEGRASFKLNFTTDFMGYAGHQDKISISLTANANSVSKFDRIAAAIAEIMAEDDTPEQGLVEAIVAGIEGAMSTTFAKIVNATTREVALELALRDCRAWVEHWEQDRLGKMAPTEGSLQSALNVIDAALAVSRPIHLQAAE